MARQSIVGDKSLAFAKRIAKLYRFLVDKKKETIMSKQILRSGTSIGANIREGLFGQSRKDFISKMNIALKEAGETDYWLEILYSAEYLTEMEYKSLKNDNDELIKMLSSIIKTTKENTPKSPKNS
ncbi:MAG: four helix bundle protein [Bacteroidales bacterium]|nr:four helix bundle protein [Bacteroidales bacterium]